MGGRSPGAGGLQDPRQEAALRLPSPPPWTGVPWATQPPYLKTVLFWNGLEARCFQLWCGFRTALADGRPSGLARWVPINNVDECVNGTCSRPQWFCPQELGVWAWGQTPGVPSTGGSPALPQGLSACPLAVPSALIFLAPLPGRLVFWSGISSFRVRIHSSSAQSPWPRARCSAACNCRTHTQSRELAEPRRAGQACRWLSRLSPERTAPPPCFSAPWRGEDPPMS